MGRSRVPVILSKVIGETPSPMCEHFPKGSSVKSTVVQTLGAKSIAKKKRQQNPRTKKKTLSNLATESNRGRETHSKNEIEVKSRNKTKQNKTKSLNGAS